MARRNNRPSRQRGGLPRRRTGSARVVARRGAQACGSPVPANARRNAAHALPGAGLELYVLYPGGDRRSQMCLDEDVLPSCRGLRPAFRKIAGCRAATSRTSPAVTYVSRCSTIDLVAWSRIDARSNFPENVFTTFIEAGIPNDLLERAFGSVEGPSSQRGPKDQRCTSRSSANGRRCHSICLASPRSVTLRVVSWGTLTSRMGVPASDLAMCHLPLAWRGEPHRRVGPLPGAALALRTAD